MNQGLWLGHSKVVNDGETPPSAGVSPSPGRLFSPPGVPCGVLGGNRPGQGAQQSMRMLVSPSACTHSYDSMEKLPTLSQPGP